MNTFMQPLFNVEDVILLAITRLLQETIVEVLSITQLKPSRHVVVYVAISLQIEKGNTT